MPAASTAFLNPDVDPTTQLGYATNAIREGGLFGVGVGEGQVKWSLPDAHTDFIVAVAAEEYGLVLVAVLIVLYASIVVRSLFRLMRERDTFIRLAGTGLVCMFGVQAMINMGVAVRLLACQRHDFAVCQLRRILADCHRDRSGYAPGLYPDAPAGRDCRLPEWPRPLTRFGKETTWDGT